MSSQMKTSLVQLPDFIADKAVEKLVLSYWAGYSSCAKNTQID